MLCSWCGSLCVTGTETYAVSLCLYTDSFWRCETWPTSLYNKALPCKTTHWHWPGTWLWDEWPETEIKSSRFFLGERRWGMRWKWCEKALGYPGMARNSPSLSGSSGERQKRLRRKESKKSKRSGFFCHYAEGGTEENMVGIRVMWTWNLGLWVDSAEANFPTVPQSLQHVFLTNSMSLLLPPSILPQTVISVQTPHSVPV